MSSDNKFKGSSDIILESHEDLFSSNSDGDSNIDENEAHPMTQRTPDTANLYRNASPNKHTYYSNMKAMKEETDARLSPLCAGLQTPMSD